MALRVNLSSSSQLTTQLSGEGLPHLAHMARQWLGCPATSAGVERLFSKAGSMHHDLKGSMMDGSLEHSLIATANTE